jgi:pyruvate dehydrogenase E1 component alpha subunit
VEFAAAGNGPTLIEAHTYRIDAHTNADNATLYRTDDEVRFWLERDPLQRLETYLRASGELDDAQVAVVAADAEAAAADLRERMNADVVHDPAELFAHVYAEPTAALLRQQADLIAELADAAEADEPNGPTT